MSPRVQNLGSHTVSPPTACPELVFGHLIPAPWCPRPHSSSPVSHLPLATRSHGSRKRPTFHVCHCTLLLDGVWGGCGEGQVHAPHLLREEKGCGPPHPELAATWHLWQAILKLPAPCPPSIGGGPLPTLNPDTENAPAWRLQSLQTLRQEVAMNGGTDSWEVGTDFFNPGQSPALSSCTRLHKLCSWTY